MYAEQVGKCPDCGAPRYRRWIEGKAELEIHRSCEHYAQKFKKLKLSTKKGAKGAG